MLSIENLVKAKNSYGGTSPSRVKESIEKARQRTLDNKKIVKGKIEALEKLEEEIKNA